MGRVSIFLHVYTILPLSIFLFFLPMNLQIKHLISGESPCTLVLLLSPCHYNPYLRILCEQEDKYIMRVWVVG